MDKLINNINLWVNLAINTNQNIALYRKPGSNPILLLDNKPLEKVKKNIENLEKGFLLANYKGNLWHMKAAKKIEIGNLENPKTPKPFKKTAPKWAYYTTYHEQKTTSKSTYINEVQISINTILNTDLNKVVPSKIKLYHLSKNFSLAKAFVQLCSKYPAAFVSVISTKEFGTWLTATPELLINVNKKGVFRTMSLAGTQKNDPNKPLHEVAWVDKDIEEQAMVSRYIVNRFKEIRLREFIEKGPITMQAGNLNHLCTIFNIDTKVAKLKNFGSIMLNLLHPTSAVCGMPKEAARNLIEEIENHKRKFYTGYLGPVNMDKETSLYVNVRCMELFKNKANLFAGAGVTAISNPEKEWEETELKFNTLLNTIG